MRPIRVGLNLVFLDPSMAGLRVVAVNLVRSILVASQQGTSNRYRLFTTAQGETCLLDDVGFRDAAQGLGDRFEIVRLAVNPRRKGLRILVEQSRLASYSLDIDVMHSFDYTFPYVSRARSIVTIHDLNYLNHPETFTSGQLWFRRIGVPISLRLADRIVTISETARGEIIERFPAAEDRVSVIHNGFTPMGAASPATLERGSEGPYLLAVGTLKAHKNYSRLIEAYAGLSDDKLKLVIVGRDDGISTELTRLAERLGVAGRVNLRGFVSSEELRRLYANAEIFVAPSLYEGFGLPVLEAMAMGVPVACSNLEVFEETGGGAAIYFDPSDPSSITSALRTLLGDRRLRAQLAEKGLERPKRFTWENSAAKVLALYRDVLGDRTSGRTSRS